MARKKKRKVKRKRGLRRPPAATKPSFYLTVRYKEFENPNENANDYEGNYGFILPGASRRYTIWINSSTSLLNQVGTLFHEFGHFLFYTVFKELFVNEKKEHIFCEKIDDTARQGFKEYIEE